MFPGQALHKNQRHRGPDRHSTWRQSPRGNYRKPAALQRLLEEAPGNLSPTFLWTSLTRLFPLPISLCQFPSLSFAVVNQSPEYNFMLNPPKELSKLRSLVLGPCRPHGRHEEVPASWLLFDPATHHGCQRAVHQGTEGLCLRVSMSFSGILAFKINN